MVAVLLLGTAGGPARLDDQASLPKGVSELALTAGVAKPLAPASPGGERVISPVPVEVSAPSDASAMPAAAAAPVAPVPGIGTPAAVFAVVIGIDDYPGEDYDLISAGRDADDMLNVLAAQGVPAANVVSLRDEQATGAALGGAAQWLAAAAGPGSTAVYFYAGHVQKLASTTEAMVAADGSVVRDVDLADDLASMAASEAWVVMAACYGGGFDEVLAPGRVLTAASGADQLAYDNGQFGRSYLAEYVLRRGLLNGEAGGPTVQQAVAWAQSALVQDFPQRLLTNIDESDRSISLDGADRHPDTLVVAPPPPRLPIQLPPIQLPPVPPVLPPIVIMVPDGSSPPPERVCFLIFCRGG